MKKHLVSLLLLSSFLPLQLFAISFSLNFTSSGKSTTLDSVKVVNLSNGASIVTTDSVLLSDEYDGIVPVKSDESLKIIPTPTIGNYIVEFNSLNFGTCIFRILSIDGKVITSNSKTLNSGINRISFNAISGLNIIHIYGNGYNYASKIVNFNQSANFKNNVIFMDYGNSSINSVRVKAESPVKILLFKEGDRILVSGYSGNYSNIIVDLPTASKTLNFVQTECKDASGNYYSTVKIGNKIWMAENLKTAKYRNGDNIVNFSSNSDWGFYSIGSYCVYNNNDTNSKTYGNLYNWFAINDSRNIAPDGWHVAKDDDWANLVSILGGESVAGYKIKETGLVHWATNPTATNESGFSGLPSGYRLSSGSYTGLGTNANWWTADENSSTLSWYRAINSSTNGMSRDYYNKNTGFAVRCVKDPEQPEIKTLTPQKVSYTTITTGAIIISDGGSTINSIGVCWSLTPNPTILNNKTIEPVLKDTVISEITGLTPGTKYYIRAYATTSSETVYGNELEVFAQDYDTIVTDIDGNSYHVITIGNQTWMVENLKTTRYRNGDVIGTTNYASQTIYYDSNPKYQWAYNGAESNVQTYGRLYTWHVVADERSIAPEGWHIPSVYEIDSLQNYMITNGYNFDKTTTENKIAKALSSVNFWLSSTVVGSAGNNSVSNNRTAFSMIPSGYKGFDGYFYEMGNYAHIWTLSTSEVDNNAYSISIKSNLSNLIRNSLNKNYGFSARCIKNSIPITATNSATFIKSTSFTLNGAVLFDGGEQVSEYGFCYSKNAIPQITDDKLVSNNYSSGTFYAEIDSLSKETEYNVRAYSINKNGISYGNVIKVKTLLTDPETVKDIDGNEYSIVTIGTQKWFGENLKTTRLNDSTAIPLVTDASVWSYSTTPGYCFYNNDYTNFNTYGAMYNWYAVNSGKLAPYGWHVASDAEWTTLTNYLGGNNNAGGKIKEAGTSHWLAPNTGATNESGFTALPGGGRGNGNGSFFQIKDGGFWWTSTPQTDYYTYFRSLSYSSTSVGRSGSGKENGLYVRCIKNSLPEVKTNSVTSIFSTKATVNSVLTSNGGDINTELGFYWDTLPSPTKYSFTKKITDKNSNICIITDLIPNTKYYLRAYATNSEGTVFGNEVTFTTLINDPEGVVDIDGNFYHTITIGNQVWMVENLKTTKYRNGDIIGSTNTILQDISAEVAPKYQWAYLGNESNVEKYGRLYTWYAANDSRKITPEGWHVPTDSEWSELETYLMQNGFNYDGTTSGNKYAKALAADFDWNYYGSQGAVGNTDYPSIRNISGFTALPGGVRDAIPSIFGSIGNYGIWWTSTEFNNKLAWDRGIDYSLASVGKLNVNKSNGYSVRCIKNSKPVTSTKSATKIKSTSFRISGEIVFNGGEDVTECGFCYSYERVPDTTDTKKISDTVISNEFFVDISNLKPETEYIVRAFSINKNGISYGNIIKVKTFLTDPLTVEDIEGNVYQTVQIGNQVWMVENLKTTKYNDGTPLINTSSGLDWLLQTTGAYCWAQDNISFKNTYGAYYNWYAVSSGKLAPDGWRIPTEQDWITLLNYLGGADVAGGKLKSTGTTYWYSPNTGATNESGFTALPAGYRTKANGSHPGMGEVAAFWSSTGNFNNYGRLSLSSTNSIFNYGMENGNFGMNVRCIKNS